MPSCGVACLFWDPCEAHTTIQPVINIIKTLGHFLFYESILTLIIITVKCLQVYKCITDDSLIVQTILSLFKQGITLFIIFILNWGYAQS
jgi:hypothetical protein